MRPHAKRAWRPLTAVAAIAATALAGTAYSPTPAQSAVSTGDCAVAFPVADLVPADPVHGLTVDTGTTPEPFTGEVLGVLANGIAPGLDMVMVRLTSTEIDRVGGIWAGMSGSPVYAEDGRLIGAVSYGLSWGPSPVAGVTPFEDMDDYLATTLTRVPVTPTVARTIAARTDVTASQAAEGFTQLPMPLGVSGVSQHALTKTRGRAYLNKNARTIGVSAPGVGAGPETIVAGGNLALSAAYGDVTVAAVGTATSVCNDRVVGFGHPATFSGKSTAGLHPADALFVQEDPVFGNFKVANISDPAGTITDDHLAGITGNIGPLPETSSMTATLTYGSRTRTGTSYVALPRYTATTAFYQLIGDHERIIDGYQPGSEVASWTIEGRDKADVPFTINMGDRYVDDYAVVYESVWDLPDMLYTLSRFPGVKIDNVTWTGTASDVTDRWVVDSVEFKAGGTWNLADQAKDSVIARAGSTLKLRVILDNDGVTVKVPMEIVIPARMAGAEGELYLLGGSRVYTSFYRANNLADFIKTAETATRNDEVYAAVFAGGKRSSFEKETTSDAQDKVVTGRKHFGLIIN